MIQPRFEWAKSFSENGLAPVKINGKCGYINESGKFVIQPSFEYADAFSVCGLAWVRSAFGYGYINESGKFMIQPIFDDIARPNAKIYQLDIQTRNYRITAYKKRKEEEQKRKAEEARINAERCAAEEKRIAAEKADRRSRGVCQHCGGSFKGFFTKTCANCGKKKDY